MIESYLKTRNFDALGLAQTHEVLTSDGDFVHLTDGSRRYVAVYLPDQSPFLADDSDLLVDNN